MFCMRKLCVWCLSGIFVFAVGCTRKMSAPIGLAQQATKREIAADRAPAYTEARLGGGGGGQAESKTTSEQKLIRTASLDLVVNDIHATLNDVRSLASTKGGYVEESSTAGEGQYDFNASMKIRVPAARLDEALSEIKKLAVRTVRESVQAQDVTRQY